MSHVDEGTIHAYLDGAFGQEDPERARIEQHLADCAACRSRLEVERGIRDRAADVLGVAAPDAVRVEPFEAILAARRAGGAGGEVSAGGGDRKGLEPQSGTRRFRFPLALAASLTLAVTAGWFARQYLPSRQSAGASDRQLEGATAEFGRDTIRIDEIQRSMERGQNVPATPRAAAESQFGAVTVPDSVGIRAERPERRLAVEEVVVTGSTAVAAAGQVAPRPSAAPPSAASDLSIRTADETRRVAESMLRQEPVRLPASRDVAGEGADAGTINAVVGRVLASDAAGEWRAVTLDSIEDRLGARPVGLPELEADSIQIGTLDGAAVARLVYVIDGVPVELLQWASGSLNESVLADRDDRQANLQRARAAETEAAEAKAVAVVSPGAFRFSGIDFLLRGALPQDSLAALSLKVRSR